MPRPAHALAAAVYVAVALLALGVAWQDPTRLLPYPLDQDADLPFKAISQSDQIKEANATIRAAHALLHAPREILDGDCFPIARAVTLGEHLFSEGLVATVPYAITGDPILSFNVVLVFGLAMAGIGMYALAWHWTRAAGAAFVAGLLFEILPIRIGDPQHPFCHADHWVPLFLLFFHRVVLHGRWRDAALLAVVGSLQFLESAYNILEFALLVGPFCLIELVRHWRRLPAIVPLLTIAGAAVGTVAVVVLGPFAETRATWPSGHVSFPLQPGQFLLGGSVYAGTTAVVLAIVALVDRVLRRGALRDDPRLAILAAALVCAWAGTAGLPIPVVGGATVGLFAWLWPLIAPALSGLRGLPLVTQGVLVATTFLAAFGVTAIGRALPRVGRGVLVGVVTAAGLLEVFHPDLARRSFGRTVAMGVEDVRPQQADIDLARQMVDGPVLDVPFIAGNIRYLFTFLPHYAVLRMFHQHRIAGCPTSLGGAAEPDVAALAARLPDPRAADALYAMGFRNVVVHEEFLNPGDLNQWRARVLTEPPGGPRFTLLGRSGSHEILALQSPTSVLASFDILEPVMLPASELRVSTPEVKIPVVLRNGWANTFRHPDPIRPTPVTVHWRALGGQKSVTTDTRLLFPLALAPGEELLRTAVVTVPGEGSYDVTITMPGTEGGPLARALVTFALPPEIKALLAPAGAPAGHD